MKMQAGFSLIELMIAVAIIGILTAIAMPAYNDYVIRSKIPDATSGLAQKRVQMEQYFQDNHVYDDAAVTPHALPCDPNSNNSYAADTTTSKYFDFSCSVRTGTAFTLQAVGKSSMTGFTYTVDQNNTKQTTAAPAGWAAAAMPTNCWITNKGGAC